MPKLLAVATAAVALYAAALAWLTWPLTAHLGTHLASTHPACNFDTLHIGWVLAHETRALLSDPLHLTDARIFFPTPGTLFHGDGAFGSLPFFLPAFVVTGNPTLALNLAFLLPLALTAAALHLVVWRWAGSHAAGMVAAATFLTTRWTLWDFVPAAPQYATLFYLPIIVYVAASPLAGRRTLLLGVLVALQALSSMVYIAAAVFLPLGVLAVGRLMRRATRAEGLRTVAALAIAAAIVAPIAAGYVAVRAGDPDLARRSWWTWWTPITALPFGPFVGFQTPTAVPLVALAVVAAGAVARVVVRDDAAGPRRAWGHAAFWALASIVFSMAPTATWFGAPVTLPHTVIGRWLPVYAVIREPARLGVSGLVGLALLAGLGFAAATRWLPARGGRGGRLAAAALVVAVMYAERTAAAPRLGRPALASSYPLAPAIRGDGPIVEALSQQGGPLLELPVGLGPISCAPAYHARAMYRAIFHRRPLLNGYSGYWPAGFMERMTLADRLPDASAIAALRDETGLAMVLVHTADLPPERAAPWWRLAETADGRLELAAREGTDLLFAVR